MAISQLASSSVIRLFIGLEFIGLRFVPQNHHGMPPSIIYHDHVGTNHDGTNVQDGS
jgi:hypothetical protein